MTINRKLSIAVFTIAIAASAIGYSFVPPAHASTLSTVSANSTPEATTTASQSITATAKANAPAVVENTPTALPTFSPSGVIPEVTPVAEAVVNAPEPAVTAPVAPVQTAQPPTPAKAAPAPAPVEVVPEVSREVYVGLAGGQDVVDQQRGPVLFPLPAGFPPYVAEHDIAGGWARFGTLSAGMTVRMSGLVIGTYTVGQIINVPKHSTTNEFRKFNVMPKVMLQTCVPGTNRMIVVGLY